MGTKEDSDSNVELSQKVETQDKEIERLNEELKKLKKCVRGVNVLGRALKETKEENKRLQEHALMQMSVSSSTSFNGTPQSTSSSIASTSFINHNNRDNSDKMTQPTSEMEDIDDFTQFGNDESSDDELAGSTDNSNEGTNTKEEDKSDKDDDDLMGIEKDNKIKDSSTERKEEDDASSEEVTRYEATNSSENEQDVHLANGDVLVEIVNSTSVDLHTSTESKTSRDRDVKGIDDHYQTSCDDPVTSDVKPNEPAAEQVWKERNAQLHEENEALKSEVKQVVKVNNDWEKFWNRKKATFDKQMKEKDATIGVLQKFKDAHKECGKTSRKDGDAKLSHRRSSESDEVSMLTKEHVNNLESVVEKQREELTKERQKSQHAHKLARSLLKQNEELSAEVKRLNGTLEVELQKSMQLNSGMLGSFASEQHQCSDDILRSNEVTHKEPTRKTREPQNQQHMMAPVDMKKLRETQVLRSSAEFQQVQQHQYHLDEQHQQQEEEFVEHHYQDEVAEAPNDDDLSVEELKERIMLLKEQKNAYESDFRKERRDREGVVGELDKMKEKLEKTKQKLKQRKHYTKQPGKHQVPIAANGQMYVNTIPVQTAVYAPANYYQPRHHHERNHLVAHGVQHDYNYWYGPPDAEEPPYLCPRYQKAL